ncbi:hypothetical protein F511_36008 [Dorcoceras hygrometricum]|uniref:Uncharacterized protein n=1 Tax=Dorcoceras hygrometricum TaxID=472368 RepID=A0A2Z7BEV6_9LAMI|nr:hypothetical protein F511_36008 [Dorcoceras hygrometricum]
MMLRRVVYCRLLSNVAHALVGIFAKSVSVGGSFKQISCVYKLVALAFDYFDQIPYLAKFSQLSFFTSNPRVTVHRELLRRNSRSFRPPFFTFEVALDSLEKLFHFIPLLEAVVGWSEISKLLSFGRELCVQVAFRNCDGILFLSFNLATCEVVWLRLVIDGRGFWTCMLAVVIVIFAYGYTLVVQHVAYMKCHLISAFKAIVSLLLLCSYQDARASGNTALSSPC